MKTDLCALTELVLESAGDSTQVSHAPCPRCLPSNCLLSPLVCVRLKIISPKCVQRLLQRSSQRPSQAHATKWHVGVGATLRRSHQRGRSGRMGGEDSHDRVRAAG